MSPSVTNPTNFSKIHHIDKDEGQASFNDFKKVVKKQKWYDLVSMNPVRKRQDHYLGYLPQRRKDTVPGLNLIDQVRSVAEVVLTEDITAVGNCPRVVHD